MPAHSVRIYDPTLWQWIQREAERRGPGVRTSDVAESALALLRSSMEGSDAPEPEAAPAPGDPVRRRKSSDRGAESADALSGEAVVQPVPAVDPVPGVEREYEASDNPLTEVLGETHVYSGSLDLIGKMIVPPVQRVKGPDSGPDDELGF